MFGVKIISFLGNYSWWEIGCLDGRTNAFYCTDLALVDPSVDSRDLCDKYFTFGGE